MSLVNAETGEIVVEMTPQEARNAIEEMRDHRDDLWRLAVETHDRRAWAALGYPSWRDCMEAELGVKSSQAYRLLDHGRTMLALAPAETLDSPMGESPLPVSERQTRPLSKLPTPEAKAQAWQEAVEEAAAEDRAPTAKDVERVVNRRTESTTTERTPPIELPAQDEAEQINDAFSRHVDPDADYRKRVTDALSRAHDLVAFDIPRAISTGGESTAGHRQMVVDLSRWCETYLASVPRPEHLRSVQ